MAPDEGVVVFSFADNSGRHDGHRRHLERGKSDDAAVDVSAAVPDEHRRYGDDDDAQGHAHRNRDVTMIGQHIFRRHQFAYFHFADFGAFRPADLLITSTTSDTELWAAIAFSLIFTTSLITFRVSRRRCEMYIVCDCLSLTSLPHYSMDYGLGCNLANGTGCPLVVHYMTTLNIARTRNVSECLYSLCAWLY